MWQTDRMREAITTPPQRSTFAPIRAGSLVGTVCGQVREAILRGEIRAGEPLRDSVLAADMGVSRAPVREALRLLEQSGLVVKSANKPYRVTSIDREDLGELAVLRIALETTAARLVIARRADLSAVRAALADMQAAWQRGDIAEINDLDLRFHRCIVAAAGVGRLLVKHDELVDQLVLAWLNLERTAPREADSMAVHTSIVETFEAGMAAGDSTAIQQLLIDHIRTGMGCTDLVI